MKRKTSIFLLLFTACLFVFPEAEAQNETRKTFGNSLAVQPLYWLNNGFRIDYERRLKNPSQWLQVSAIGYYVENESNPWDVWTFSDFSFNEVWGAGLEVNYKWFPFRRQRVYVSGGLSASHFNMEYDEVGYRYTSYQIDGLTYYESQWENYQVSQRFNRIGTNLCTGIQNRPTRRFLIDGYVGIGFMYSFYDPDKYHPDNYLNSLSYRGLTLTAGFRIGFRL
ncbi:MAG: hypothetical protein LBS88_13565 [Tannerellaceae bacterium]|jgi:hypothetical protein|nr:hypothetical protein [Tannerellaceae bacterium]